jgi:hypothetical protein
MPAEDLFDAFSSFGDRILHGIANQESEARKYRFLLEKINEILINTHRIVLERLDQVEKAGTHGEVQAALRELGGDALQESFRMRGYCDVFEAYGRALLDMALETESRAAPGGGDLGAIRDFAMMLMDREEEVSRIYTERIKAVARLGEAEGDLAALKAGAGAARSVLTEQMADFTAKVARFRQISP